MAGETVSYKCPRCAGALTYTTSGKLHCDFCGSDYNVEDFLSVSGSAGFEWISGKNGEKAPSEGDAELKREDNGFFENSRIYVCRSCGARVECDEVTAATHCPYCDNEVILSDRVSDRMRPNAIIPFSFDNAGLIERVMAHMRSKKLLPRDFFKKQKMSGIQGVYVPFWLYDTTVSGSLDFEGVRVRSYSDSDYDYTERSYYGVTVGGDMRFERIPVDASVKMRNDLMDSVAPFDYAKMVPFDPAYLSGYLADCYDDAPDSALPRAVRRSRNSAESILSGKVKGHYDTLTLKESALRISEASVKYVLLPVYLVNCEYKDRKYAFAVNGQTGKMVGELPISRAKVTAYFFGIAGAVCAAVTTAFYFLFR